VEHIGSRDGRSEVSNGGRAKLGDVHVHGVPALVHVDTVLAVDHSSRWLEEARKRDTGPVVDDAGVAEVVSEALRIPTLRIPCLRLHRLDSSGHALCCERH